MRELFESLPRVDYRRARHLRLLDTCFFLELAERCFLHKLLNERIAMTSFNAEEVESLLMSLRDKVRGEARRFLKRHPELLIVTIPVHPGDAAAERSFVESIDDSLLLKVRDPSDAVLIATAIATQSEVFTKDKHHLFTVTMENYLAAYGIHVWKEWKDAALRETPYG